MLRPMCKPKSRTSRALEDVVLRVTGAISEGETMEELRANMIEAILLVQESIKEEAELRHEQITQVIV
jgi:predicted RNase H-like HicB family nuclease